MYEVASSSGDNINDVWLNFVLLCSPLLLCVPAQPRREEGKRGLSIGLRLRLPTSTEGSGNDMESLKKEILETLATESESKKGDELKKILEEKMPHKNLLLKPTYDCDRWDSRTRTCWLDRNVGDTVTFSLTSGVKKGRPDVTWKKVLAQKDSRHTTDYVIDRKRFSRNIVMGRRGYELRVSPITELDLDDNQFTASFEGDGSSPDNAVSFRILPIPEDLGFVYVGETLDLSLESFVALPLEGATFHWYTEREGEFWTLPSNMRVSSQGATLRISELREEQEGVVACSVYTNKGVHAIKKRFLIRRPASKDVLNSDSDFSVAFHDGGQTKRRKKTTFNKRTTDSSDKKEDIYQKKGKKASRAHKANNGIKTEDNRKATSKSGGKGPSISKTRRHLANHNKFKKLQKTFNKLSIPSANQTAATKQKTSNKSASKTNRESDHLNFRKSRRHLAKHDTSIKTQVTLNMRSFLSANQTGESALRTNREISDFKIGKTRRHLANHDKLTKTQKTFNKRSFPLGNQTADTNQEETNKSASRSNREISDVKIEDDQYTIVKPEAKHKRMQQETKRYLDNDETYPEDEEELGPMSQDRDEKLLEAGMRLSFSNTTDMETVVNFDLDKEAYTQEDKVAELVSYCTKDVQCSNHATCIRTSLSQRGFCRCLPGYYGPGVFCREEM